MLSSPFFWNKDAMQKASPLTEKKRKKEKKRKEKKIEILEQLWLS